MTQYELEILQLAQRIQLLSDGHPRRGRSAEEDLLFRLTKIRELANALVPRIEANYQG